MAKEKEKQEPVANTVNEASVKVLREATQLIGQLDEKERERVIKTLVVFFKVYIDNHNY